MALTKTDVANYRKELELALRGVATRTGIDVSIGRIVYNPDGSSVRCKIEGIQRGAGKAPGPVSNPKDAALDGNSWCLGNNFDKTKTYNSPSLGAVKFVGYARQAKKYPFIVLASNGRRYKITSLAAKEMVAAGAIA